MLEATDAERDARLAELLEAAIRFHAEHGQPDERCPVCGTADALGPTWSLRKQADVAALRDATRELHDARRRLSAAEQAVGALFAPVTPAALRGADLPVEQALQAWDVWAADRGSPSAARTLQQQLLKARERAVSAVADRDAARVPLEVAISQWLGAAQDAARDKAAVTRLTAAEEWMKDASPSCDRERLRPVVDAAQANWTQLRHESNVALGTIELAKQGNQKLVQFDVTVDGTDASAFGVMSQGELSALAMSSSCLAPRCRRARSGSW